jgi:hypothetical protein
MGISPLKPFTGVGVTDGDREEAEAEGQHEDVQHEMLLYGAGPDPWPPVFVVSEVPSRAFVFETGAMAKL